MAKIAKELGLLVRNYRTQKEMTQLELSKKLGYGSTQFVSLFERGLSKIPYNVLGKLIVILGIPEKKVVKLITEAYQSDLQHDIDTGKRSIQGL